MQLFGNTKMQKPYASKTSNDNKSLSQALANNNEKQSNYSESSNKTWEEDALIALEGQRRITW